MSFILDALRKSEHERQRSATPGIAQVPFGATRRELPSWTIALIVVLSLAVLALGAAWLRSEWSGAREARAGAPAQTPFAAQPAEASRAISPADRASIRDTTPRGLGPPSTTRSAPTQTPALASAATQAPRERVEPPPASVIPEPAPAARRRSGPVLPSAAALAAEGVAVPALELQLLAFYDNPADRYVFINGAKYGEGATLTEGPKVVSIETGGAVLAYHGREFLLSQ